ncbi:MAG: TlpA family protein disulfide reductase [Alphaproteobacteria bacterium]|nr:TlpA family protein disulfide reductase [Alphaproteobacteria bacterium]
MTGRSRPGATQRGRQRVALRWVAWVWLAWFGLHAVAHADTPEAAQARTAAAALSQARIWLDMGEIAKAVALTRKGRRDLPDDPGWTRARLDALYAAGMDPWIEAEYTRSTLRGDVAVAVAVWRVERGQLLSVPPGLTGPDAEVARGRLALGRGDLDGAAQALTAAVDDEAHRALATELAIARHDDDALAAIARAWPTDDAVVLAPLAPVLAATGKGPVAAAGRALRTRAERQVDAAVDALPVLRVAELALDAGDADLLGRCRTRLEALRGDRGPATAQELMDSLLAGPTGWTVWEVPPRPRYTLDAIDALGKRLAADDRPVLPWVRPDERVHLAIAIAEALAARDRAAAADKVLEDNLGPCAPTITPGLYVALGDKRRGRDAALGALLRCVGGTDLIPAVDPAGYEVDRLYDDLAAAWFSFGRVAALAAWKADAALAFAIAARLAPSPDAVALARARAADAHLAVDGSGVPTVPALLDAMRDATWLHPPEALLASRARLAVARTAALLAPTPEHLAARRLPDNLCMPTLRARCMLERAVAIAAYARARTTPPDPIPEPKDAGAELAAGRWLERLDRVWFQRQAELARVAGASLNGDLAAILKAEPTVRVGRAAPRWSSGGIRSVDLQGQVVVLAFWASWSKPSAAWLAVLDGYAGRWSADDLPVRVIAVSVDDDPARFTRALTRLDWTDITVLRDEGLRRTFRVDDIPTAFVVDGAGVLRQVRSGYGGGDLSWLDDAVRAWGTTASPEPAGAATGR